MSFGDETSSRFLVKLILGYEIGHFLSSVSAAAAFRASARNRNQNELMFSSGPFRSFLILFNRSQRLPYDKPCHPDHVKLRKYPDQ